MKKQKWLNILHVRRFCNLQNKFIFFNEKGDLKLSQLKKFYLARMWHVTLKTLATCLLSSQTFTVLLKAHNDAT